MVNLLENGRIISFFLFSTRRAAQTKKLDFLIKLVTLNVCARGSRDFPATPHPTDTVFVPGLSSRIPNDEKYLDMPGRKRITLTVINQISPVSLYVMLRRLGHSI